MVSTNRLGHHPSTVSRLPTAPDSGAQRPANTPTSTPQRLRQPDSSFQAQPSRAPTALQVPPSQTNDKADDRVVVLDDGGDHAANVEEVITDKSSIPSSQIRKLKVSLTSVSGATFQQRIENDAASFLQSTTARLKEINDDPGNVQVINQSMGLSKLRLANNIWNPAAETKRPNPSTDKEALKKLAGELNATGHLKQSWADLEKNVKDGDERKRLVLQALVDCVSSTVDGSAKVQAAKKDYDAMTEQLGKKGIFIVLSAGNTGETLKEWTGKRMKTEKELSDIKLDGKVPTTEKELKETAKKQAKEAEEQRKRITAGTDFADSLLFNYNDNVLVVAASTGGDDIAPFSTPSRYVSVAVDGTNIPVKKGRADGTSFAAPQVTALIADMRGKGLDVDQVRTILQAASENTLAPPDWEGAGILDLDKARKLTDALVKEQQRQQPPPPQAQSVLSLPVTFRG